MGVEDLPPLFAPGQRLGRYELLRRLAVGGMAEVYLAYSVGPGDFRRVVAIKRLLPHHALDPQLLRMFLDEARLMARLSHPSIPQVTDVDDGDGGNVPYFVMEYVHGTDLRGVLNAAQGPLPFEQSLAIASSVAAGLHHAHEHRGASGQPLEIVHRDVSPSNVLISFDGAVKVSDFGVAKWNEQKSFTQQGQLKGKFAHMSPEQCRGEALDRRSDVFALGTLLYEMTTGHPPFMAESEYQLLTQIVSRDVAPPRRDGQSYPEQLERIVMRSLCRDRAARYPSTQELQLDLESFAREHRMVVSPVALARYLESLFGAQVTEWRDALASGKNLADHLSSEATRAPRLGDRTALDRTATDTFALASPALAAALVSPASTAASDSPVGTSAAAARKRPASRSKRVLAVAATAIGGFAMWLVAMELTSVWSRNSPSRSERVPVTSTGGPVSAVPHPDPVPAVAVAPAASLSAPVSVQLAAARGPSVSPSVASRPKGVVHGLTAVGSARAPAQGARWRRDEHAGASRSAHRETTAREAVALPLITPASDGVFGTDPHGPAAAPTAAAGPAAPGVPAPPAVLAVPSPPAGGESPAAPAGAVPTPFRVWDPDSPVPP